MAKETYTKNAVIEVDVEVFLVAGPRPARVFEGPTMPGTYYYSDEHLGPVPIADGDALLTDEHGKTIVLSAARLAKSYTKKP